MSKHRFAIVGAGVIGRHHGGVIAGLADRITLAAVADVEMSRAVSLTEERGGTPYASLSEAGALATKPSSRTWRCAWSQ